MPFLFTVVPYKAPPTVTPGEFDLHVLANVSTFGRPHLSGTLTLPAAFQNESAVGTVLFGTGGVYELDQVHFRNVSSFGAGYFLGPGEWSVPVLENASSFGAPIFLNAEDWLLPAPFQNISAFPSDDAFRVGGFDDSFGDDFDGS